MIVNTQLLISIISSSLILTSCAQENSQDDWITQNLDGFSISHPNTWEFNEEGQAGTTFVVVSEKEDYTDDFRENVNLLIQDLSNYELNLDEFVELSENQLPSIFPDGEILTSKRHKLDGREFHENLYTGTQGKLDLQFMAYYWLKNNHAYILTLTCERSKYDQYKSVGKKILSSFKLE